MGVLEKELPEVVELVKDVNFVGAEFRGVTGGKSGQVVIASLKKNKQKKIEKIESFESFESFF